MKNASAYELNKNEIGDVCNEALASELDRGASKLPPYEFPEKTRHVFFTKYKELDVTSRYDCANDIIIRKDLILLYESEEEALPFYEELYETLSDKHSNMIYDNREYPDLPESKLDKFLGYGNTHLRSWREPEYRTDLYLFKHMDIWRIMVRMQKLEPGETGGGLAIIQGYDI